MSHDVFICYDGLDYKSAEELMKLFERNGLKCWVSLRDFTKGDSPVMITDAIEKSACFVLIHSKNAIMSKHVITEVDKAFYNDVPILILNIDGSKDRGSLDFLLKNTPSINLFPDISGALNRLMGEASFHAGKAPGNVSIPFMTKMFFKRIEPESKFIRGVKIALPIVAVLVLVVFFLILPMGQHTTDDGNFTMNITDVKVVSLNGEYMYTVLGKSYNMPPDPQRYVMELEFYDNDENEVFEVNSTVDEFKAGVITSFTVKEDNIEDVRFKLVDLNDNVLCQSSYDV